MGTAALHERASSERSGSQARLNPEKIQSVLSPVYRRSITGSAPSTPSAAMQTEGFKRITKPTTDDDQDSLDGSSNEKGFSQYEKWTAEEEHIFFLKLSTVSSLSLLDGFRSIAHHVPNKNRDQVKWYFYRLKGQFQKHNPDRDVEDLSQKETFQAMSFMWSEWSSGIRQKSLSQRSRQHDPTRRARYIEIMQQSLERVFEAKDRKEARIAERKAERAAQQKAAKQADRLRREQEAQMAARLKTEQEAERRQLKRARQDRSHAAAAGGVKENSSLASNMQGSRLKGKAGAQTCLPAVAKSAGRKQLPMQLEPEEYRTGAHRAKGPKCQGVNKTAADSKPSTASGSLDSDAQLSSEAESLTQADTGPIPSQLDDPTQEEHDIQLTQPQSDSNSVEEHCVGVQQHSSMSQQHPQSVVTAARKAGGQQSAAGAPLGPGLLPAHRKEPLCLRVRPLDSPTRRLMQSLGCTALLEMPNNKPKKAVEGLLRHLQMKWEKVTAQLGSGYELHLVGLLSGQQDSCLSWTSQGISTLLTLGQVQQQIQQTGPFLELSYVWLPAASLHLPGHTPDASDPAAQSKACLSALAAAGYALAKQRDTASQADASEPDQRAAEPSDANFPGRKSHRSAVATSSSSSAQVVSEAFSNLQPAASASLRTAAGSTGPRSAAGENQAPAHGLDVNSSVSGLVTPGKEHLSSLQEARIAEPADTPGSSQLAASSAHKGLAWESSSIPDHADRDFEPRLSQSHPDIAAAPSQLQAEPTAPHQSNGGTEYPQTGTLSQACQSHQLQCQELPEAMMDLDCNQSPQDDQDAVPDSLQVQVQVLGPEDLAEEPSGFLSGEPSVWSIQPPGALSAEPSGCWDNLPDVPLSSDHCLTDSMGHQQQQQQPEHHKAEADACLNGSGSQARAEPDLFSISELDFYLPPLDSPDQASMLDARPLDNQAQSSNELGLLQMVSGNARQPHGHEPISQISAHPVGAMECTNAGDDSSLVEAHQDYGGGSMTALISSQADIPKASEPARGIPLLGTVVVGVPVNDATKQGKKGRSTGGANLKISKGKQPKQPKQAKPAKAAAASKRQQQEKGLSADVPAPKKHKATKKRKVQCESPPRLPPISPGALSLQAGVKRRRLAKQVQEQAAAEAASCSHQEQAQTKLFCEQHDQLASKTAIKAASPAHGLQQAINPGHQLTNSNQANVMHANAHARHESVEAERVNAEPACGQCTQHLAEDNSQAQLQHQAQSPASQTASKKALQGASEEAGQTGGKQGDQDLPFPGSRAMHASQGSAARSSSSVEHDSKADKEPQTLSFDVGAMELFQQQDTCDAFGSFWRRTSGVGMPGTQNASQHQSAAPSAFGVGDISLGCWTDSQQAKKATAPEAAGSSPADGTGQPQGCGMAGMTDEAQQPSTAEGCGAMDLTIYFATLPNEVVAFKDLVMPSPSMVPSLGSAEQQAPDMSSADDSLQCNAECDDMRASSLDHEEGPSGCSSGVSEMASRLPTQQEIQHMDELDLSINLGSLLGPGDSWMVQEEDQLRLSHLEPHHATAANGGSLDNCKPFQELFP